VSSWRIETTTKFDKSIRKLDRVVATRIIAYLEDLLTLEDPRQRGKGLTGDRAGYWRYRIGDYRVIAEIHDRALVILAIDVSHRSTAYDHRPPGD
jgi:mRNA interferase RelE/StbE